MNWDEWHANAATLARKFGFFELALLYEELRREQSLIIDWRGSRNEILSEGQALDRHVRLALIRHLAEGAA